MAKVARYAFGCPKWQSREASGVAEDLDGNWWFFWSSGLDPEPPPGMHFVCAVKRVIDTPGLWYNTQNTDFLSGRQHMSFMEEYVGRVKNPEVIELLQGII